MCVAIFLQIVRTPGLYVMKQALEVCTFSVCFFTPTHVSVTLSDCPINLIITNRKSRHCYLKSYDYTFTWHILVIISVPCFLSLFVSSNAVMVRRQNGRCVSLNILGANIPGVDLWDPPSYGDVSLPGVRGPIPPVLLIACRGLFDYL